MNKMFHPDKENYSTVMFDDESQLNVPVQRMPMSSRVHQDGSHHMSVDQSGILRQNLRISQNFVNRNISSLSNRIS